MNHNIVYAEKGVYAGWPANNGAWQWGEELLVGFLRGPYNENAAMHAIDEPFELMQARSLDGGETWSVETTGIPTAVMATWEAPPGDFNLTDYIIRVRGHYDHGGDEVEHGGGFYASKDRGRTWTGPYAFIGLEEQFKEHVNTSRTRVLDQMVFLSRGHPDAWGRDETFCAEFHQGYFQFKGLLPAGNARCVMPAVARIDEHTIIAATRRRSSARLGGWIDAFISQNNGRTWKFLAEIGITGSNNGNPPALIASGRTLVCAFGNRTDKQIWVSTSGDGGKSWDTRVLRDAGLSDIGYPQLFSRSDGKLVCVYYWAAPGEQQHIAATIFDGAEA